MNRESLFSGFLIGLGATGYLALGGIPGAVIFAFGLVCVVLFGVPLYTGKAGVTNDIPALVRIWLFNIIGCALLGLLVFSLGGAPVERAQDMVAGRIAQGPWRSFLRAVGCGLIIDIAVWLYKNKGSILPMRPLVHRVRLLPFHRRRDIHRRRLEVESRAVVVLPADRAGQLRRMQRPARYSAYFLSWSIHLFISVPFSPSTLWRKSDTAPASCLSRSSRPPA